MISDLHLGVGRTDGGTWDAAEDFQWDDEFVAFLEQLNAGGQENDLVLNGDTFELWEAPNGDATCRYETPRLGCTEDAALARLNRVLAGHAPAVSALALFSQTIGNRLHVVPGDHDAALMFPSVAARAHEALGGGANTRIETRGFWISTDGQVYTEHGHQIGDRPYHFDRWPTPTIEHPDRPGVMHLEQPWGDHQIGVFLAAHETQYPIIDNLADRGAGIPYAVAGQGLVDLGDEMPPFLRYVLFRMPWSQFRVDLDAGDVRAPRWDLAEVRALGPSFLVASLPDDDRIKPAAATALEAGLLTSLMNTLNDDELTALCDYRAATRRSRRRFERILTQFDPQGPVVAECPRDASTRGGAFDYFWRSRDAMFTQALADAEVQLPEGTGPIAVFVHGHTHLVDWRQRVLELTSQGEQVIVDGFSPRRGALSPVVVNGGAWQRTITPVQLDRLKVAHDLTDDALLRALRPANLAPCYSFVQIEPYDETPELPHVRYWRQDTDGWSIAPSCGHEPSLGE